MVLTAEAFRPDNRDREVFRQPRVGRHAVLFHRFFKPREVEFFQLFTNPQRFGAAVPVVAVDHQIDIRPDRFTHRGAGFDIHFRVRREGDRRHPGMQLDGLVAARHQRFSEDRVLFRRGQTAG